MGEVSKNIEYDWNLILSRSIPIAAPVGLVFYYSDKKLFVWGSLAAGIIVSGLITYSKDSRKQNVFTSSALVILVAVAVLIMKKLWTI